MEATIRLDTLTNYNPLLDMKCPATYNETNPDDGGQETITRAGPIPFLVLYKAWGMVLGHFLYDFWKSKNTDYRGQGIIKITRRILLMFVQSLIRTIIFIILMFLWPRLVIIAVAILDGKMEVSYLEQMNKDFIIFAVKIKNQTSGK